MSATELDVCMDLLDVVIDTTNARAELTGLRSESQRRLEDLEAIEKKAIRLRAEVTALRQAVNEARIAMDDLNHHGGGTKLTRAWLTAHPAPEQVTPQPVNAFEAIAKWMDTQKDLTA